MKWKRQLSLISLLLFIGVVTVFADNTYEWLQGKKVKLAINNENLQKEGYWIKSGGQLYVPVKEISEQLEVIVDWDEENSTINLYKPDVHMAFNVRRKDGSLGTFGMVPYKSELNFFIFTQIDNLKFNVHSLKYEIVAPDGSVVYSYEEQLENQDDSFMWQYSPDIKMQFEQLGEYRAKIYMNVEEDGEYFLVSQKVLYAVEQ